MLAGGSHPERSTTNQVKVCVQVKKDWRGIVTKRKSRLVCQGFLQREGIDFNETYAPVAEGTTFRLMLAMTKAFILHLHQLDVHI